jgi:hypothetical protein
MDQPLHFPKRVVRAYMMLTDFAPVPVNDMIEQ